jgi:hypothetical protein
METSSASPSTFTRAAASSIASGSPSTCRTISAARPRASASGSNPGRAARAFEEELDRGGAPDLAVLFRKEERCDGDAHLARDVKRLAARRQDPHPGALGQQRRGDPCGFGEHVLAGIQDDEDAGGAQPRRHACERVRAADVEGVCHQANGVGRLPRPRQLHEPDAVRKLGLQQARRLQREAALAHAWRPRERHQAVLLHQVHGPVQIVLAADERRR